MAMAARMLTPAAAVRTGLLATTVRGVVLGMPGRPADAMSTALDGGSGGGCRGERGEEAESEGEENAERSTGAADARSHASLSAARG